MKLKSLGYGVGSVIQKSLDDLLNPIAKQYEWIPLGDGLPIMKSVPLNNIPARFGSLGDSMISEIINNKAANKENE
ncbi:hypothetical protein [Pasteurella testudinis]|uniref:hypothetical protein n=1 Tax=Pasteurella testudinis TaxID=761 RepID=UPI0040591E8C